MASKRTLGSRGVVCLVVAVSLTFLAPASDASSRWVNDANDTKGFLDIKAVSHGHSQGNRLKHTLTTFRRWRSRDLWCGSITFRFHGFDRHLIVAYRKDLRAVMLNSRTRESVGAPRVFRPTRRRVAVVFPKRWLRRGVDAYEWSARTVRRRETCPAHGGDVANVFQDRAPRRGRAIRHRL